MLEERRSFISMNMIQVGWNMPHTRDRQGLAAHDKDDLHGPETFEAEPSPLVEGKAEFGNENGAEPADADRRRDVACALEPIERSWGFQGDNGAGIFDAEG